jgi:hypothetical protein
MRNNLLSTLWLPPQLRKQQQLENGQISRHPQSKPSITPELKTLLRICACPVQLMSMMDRKPEILVTVDMSVESMSHCQTQRVSLSDYELSEDEWTESESESLAELEGDELEDNLQSLREEVQQLSVY